VSLFIIVAHKMMLTFSPTPSRFMVVLGAVSVDSLGSGSGMNLLASYLQGPAQSVIRTRNSNSLRDLEKKGQITAVLLRELASKIVFDPSIVAVSATRRIMSRTGMEWYCWPRTCHGCRRCRRPSGSVCGGGGGPRGGYLYVG
jgi:hypothetical protein